MATSNPGGVSPLSQAEAHAPAVIHSSELPREVAADLNRYIRKSPASTLEEVLIQLDSMARDISIRIGNVEPGGYSFVEVWPQMMQSMGDALRWEGDRLATAEAAGGAA